MITCLSFWFEMHSHRKGDSGWGAYWETAILNFRPDFGLSFNCFPGCNVIWRSSVTFYHFFNVETWTLNYILLIVSRSKVIISFVFVSAFLQDQIIFTKEFILRIFEKSTQVRNWEWLWSLYWAVSWYFSYRCVSLVLACPLFNVQCHLLVAHHLLG